MYNSKCKNCFCFQCFFNLQFLLQSVSVIFLCTNKDLYFLFQQTGLDDSCCEVLLQRLDEDHIDVVNTVLHMGQVS